MTTTSWDCLAYLALIVFVFFFFFFFIQARSALGGFSPRTHDYGSLGVVIFINRLCLLCSVFFLIDL